jgi:hypothetical protein
LSLAELWSVDPFEGSIAQLAILTDLFDFKESSGGVNADLPQGGQILQQSAYGKVTGVVNSGFGSQRALLLAYHTH